MQTGPCSMYGLGQLVNKDGASCLPDGGTFSKPRTIKELGNRWTSWLTVPMLEEDKFLFKTFPCREVSDVVHLKSRSFNPISKDSC